MSDDAIKAALEAGAVAACEAWYGPGAYRILPGRGSPHVGDNRARYDDAAAGAIAAFLHDRARTLRQTMGMQVYADFCEAEAAAVERAAKEARDE